MNTFKNKIFIASLLLIFFSASIVLYGDPDGRTGRTLKSSANGCGGCHGSSALTDVSVLLSGPDTVTAGTTRQFTITISKPSKLGAGLDIATRNGVLAPVSSNIHLTNGELTHNNDIPMTSGSVTVQFNYTAPAVPVFDTLWATGLATNSNGGSSGDDWNWAISKRITVKLPTGIISGSLNVNDFNLSQNYPNPFNPVTRIFYSIPLSDFVSIKVYNSNGNEVASLVNEKQNAGSYDIEFNAVNLASGIYYYEMNAGEFKQVRKMILIK
ncbi:MAG: T9SS type A sorting domain-containing protein [Ignavibacteria bacterium]|nr:T9SS type A sorting domain-containing protein [Ignavibacteria bacterium]